MLASYLECPWCTIIQKRKKRAKEPAHFTPVSQGRLFGNGRPDARIVGTLLHTLVNFLHAPDSPLPEDLQNTLLADSDAFVHFMRKDFLFALQQAGKMKLALFFNELSQQQALLQTTLIAPMLRYQRELTSRHTTVFTAAERFQLKLLSTKNTFADYPDRGGYVGLVGEFDQIRFHETCTEGKTEKVPAIIEFKKSLGGKKEGETAQPALFAEPAAEQETLALPTDSHAMQLMIYWLAFQTRWDMSRSVKENRGMLHEIPMPLQQELELILYNLHDGCQYQLRPTSHTTALMALIECIFYLDWAFKSGYAGQAPDHDCQRGPLTEMPPETIGIQIGYTPISAQECYLLAREAFANFKATIHWEPYCTK